MGRVEEVKNERTGKPTGSVIDRYRYPPQEMEIRDTDALKTSDGKKWADMTKVDREARIIDVKKGRSRGEDHPTSAFSHTHIGSDAMEEAIDRIAAAVLADGGVRVGSGVAYPVARQFLAAEPPRLRSGPFTRKEGESPVQFAIRAVSDLDRSVLAIQGPPGAGKTYAGAQMICDLVKRGKKVGVIGQSHKVILNLLAEVVKARGAPSKVSVAHRGDAEEVTAASSAITPLANNEAALAALQSGAVNVVGGTSWLWSRDEFQGSVDVLFVDEAGQMSLANVIAASQAASSVVLLGDPQQLEQPIKGSHPEGLDASALGHVLGGHLTIPEHRGIFLPETWRLPPNIASFTSELFYEGRLDSKAGLENQRLSGTGDLGLDGSGLWLCPVEHDGNLNSSKEEIDAIERLVARLLDGSVKWVNEGGDASPLVGKHVLVVAPYNAQVSRLAERLAPTGARVGTVDKFQGQEAPVVIYSMATSRPEDAPRGMEFLYSLNRLNVATSRARCVAIVVASPRLFEPECRTPRQMNLANALCRFREVARGLA